MELSIATKDLTDHATWVSHASPRKPSVPTLAGMVLTAHTDGTLTLAASDYETSATATTDAHVAEPGTALVSARLFATVLGTLPADGTTRLAHDGVRLNITCGTAKFALATMPVEDYPQLPPMPEPLGQVGAAELAQATARVVPFASTDETLPALEGVRMRLGASGLVVATTDRYRIAETTLPWTPALDTADHQEALVHHRSLTLATRGLSGDIHIGVGDGATTLGFTDGTRTLLTRLLDVAFPKIETFLAQTFPENTLVEVDAGALAGVVKRISVVLGRNEPVVLDLDPAAGTIGVFGADGATDTGSDLVQADLTGPAQQVAFNAAFLADVLAAHTGQMRMTVPTGTKPVLTYSGDNYQVMVMPIRVPTAQAAA